MYYKKCSMETAVITVRVPKSLKEELRKRGIELSEVVRKALEEELRKRERKELEGAATRLGELFSRMPEDDIVRSIRQQREQR
jgi:post-segregation antitoxin (ccd killing protein)